ncbi:unnamed protein product, partial [marine sediment metagenome]
LVVFLVDVRLDFGNNWRNARLLFFTTELNSEPL